MRPRTCDYCEETYEPRYSCLTKNCRVEDLCEGCCVSEMGVVKYFGVRHRPEDIYLCPECMEEVD